MRDALFCELFPGPAAPARAVCGTDPSALIAIRRPSVMLAAWTRPSPLAHHLPGGLFRVTTDPVAPDGAVAALGRALPAALAEDIAALALLFCTVARAAQLRQRLEALEHDACRRFHVDAVGLRMLCTYAGAGTQWRLGTPDEDAPHHEAAPGDVLLLKGRRRGGDGLVHRSPPVSALAEGRRRLVLCLDEAD